MNKVIHNKKYMKRKLIAILIVLVTFFTFFRFAFLDININQPIFTVLSFAGTMAGLLIAFGIVELGPEKNN